MYPNAEGLQCYLGQLEDGSHTLIWAARGDDHGEDSILLDLPDSIMDYIDPCPILCPEKNDLSKSPEV